MNRFVCMVCLVLSASSTFAEPVQLRAAPSPVDNPLKGLVPYANPHEGRFPHSMEFSYLPLSALMTGPKEFDWKPLESLLDDVASRGNQTVFRVYLEYPDKKDGIPPYLEQAGLKVTVYKNTNTAPFPPAEVRTPDYNSQLLQDALRSFIEALGEKYGNDPRIAYIHAGLLGTWGEWHTYPREELWASKQTQAIVLDAYEQAFHKTPVLLRYPAGEDHDKQLSNADRPFGYHDDSFAWATLDTGKRTDDWFYVPLLKAAGPSAIDKWKSYPIGGEIRPEVWGKIFDKKPSIKQAQDFARCVQETHVSWLMDTGMFEKKAPLARYENAIEQVRKMGYDFSLLSVDLERHNDGLSVECLLINQGVAPFYRDWSVELAIANSQGQIARTWPVDWKITELLPSEPPRAWKAKLPQGELPQGPHQLLVRVVNPLPQGKPLRFANVDQDKNVAGWMSLGAVPAEQ